MAALSWPLGLGIAVLITIALAALWWLGGVIAKAANAAIQRVPAKNRTPLQVGSLKILGSGWLQALLQLGNRLGILLWRLLLLALWPLLVVLALPVGDKFLRGFVAFSTESLSAMGSNVVAYLPDLGRIVLIVLVVRLVLGIIKWLFEEIRRGRVRLRNFDRSWARQTYNLIRMAAVVLAAILIFPLLPGSGSTGFQGIAIFIGALVSLGASSAVSNAVAGIVLTYTKAFDSGDRVRIHSTTGDVIARTLFVTRVRTIKNEDIAIPNQLVLSGPIINYSQDAGGNGVAVDIKVSLGYDVAWREAHRLLKEAATIEGVLTEPAPRVYQEELGDFAVSYTLYAFVQDPKTMIATRSVVMARVLDLFEAAGIEITSPAQVSLRNPPGPETLQIQPIAQPTSEPAAAALDEPVVEPDVPEDETLPPPADDDAPIGEAPDEAEPEVADEPVDDAPIDDDAVVDEAPADQEPGDGPEGKAPK